MNEELSKQVQDLLDAAGSLMVEIEKSKLTIKEAERILSELKGDKNDRPSDNG